MSITAKDSDFENLLNIWLEAERHYSANHWYGSQGTGSIRLVGDPHSRLLFTAPHAVNHIREGVTKYADLWTGGLAETLAHALQGRSFCPDGKTEGDPNWDTTDGIYKQALRSLLRPGIVVIDIHGMKDDYGVDINIGTGPAPDASSKEIEGRLISSFGGLGISTSVNWPFDGVRPTTVTAFVQNLGASGLQIEIAARFRRPADTPANATLLLKGLLEAVAS